MPKTTDDSETFTVTFKAMRGRSREEAMQAVRYYYGLEEVPPEKENSYIDEFFEATEAISVESAQPTV